MASLSPRSERKTGDAARVAAERRQDKAIKDWLARAGTGSRYRPWLTVQTVPSHGRVHRLLSRLSGREMHLMSDLETDCARVLDWSADVIEIREQYPLLPLEATEQIADALGVEHPKHPKFRHHVVMTTDLLVTRRGPAGQTQEAIAVKPSSELGKRRTIEKLEIERRYWSTRSTDWGITTEREVPRALVKNLEWIAPARDLTDFHISPARGAQVREVLFTRITTTTTSLVAICTDTDDRLGLEAGTSLHLVRHALFTREWRADLTKEIELTHPLILATREPVTFQAEVA